MIFKALVFFLLPFISSSVFAKNSDWLDQYLRSKSFKCTLSQDQLKKQVQVHVEQNIKRLETSLKERGSELQSITQQRDHIEIGVFPETVGLDFYILEPVTVVLGQPGATFVFQIQSTYYVDGGSPAVQKGLWFPLAIQDPGSDQACELVRVVVSEKDKRYLPSIDLTTGDPPHTLIRGLFDVVDVMDVAPISTQPPVAPAPALSPLLEERWPKPSSVPSQAVTSRKSSDSKDSADSSEDEPQIKSKKKRHERHRRRHHYRRYHRQRHYRHYYRRTRDEVPAPEPPQSQNECSGDISTWKTVTCTLTGQKTD
jgi:hypothetical protein